MRNRGPFPFRSTAARGKHNARMATVSSYLALAGKMSQNGPEYGIAAAISAALDPTTRPGPVRQFSAEEIAALNAARTAPR